MKLLSLWEPWATLMARGEKRIETRSWSTPYRGWLAIQASKGGLSKNDLRETCLDPVFYKALGLDTIVQPLNWREAFPFGKIVAVVNLVACPRTEWLTAPDPSPLVLGSDLMTEREMAFGDYEDGRYGWVTKSVFGLPDPIPFKAKQGLCDVPEAVVAEIQGQWRSRRRIPR